jgi:hypothetical protein
VISLYSTSAKKVGSCQVALGFLTAPVSLVSQCNDWDSSSPNGWQLVADPITYRLTICLKRRAAHALRHAMASQTRSISAVLDRSREK